MVTLVTEKFFKEKLKSVCGGVRRGRLLNLRGANGLEIPYLGYLELDIAVGGVTIPSCGVLVLKDTAAIVQLTEEEATWSPGDECTCENPEVGRDAQKQRKYVIS